ncbi:MAG: DMT family transporter [Rhodospirillaceae bacterium]|nr:DMT family transporter [Rhodospirillaceae bacterium]MBT6117700.1 DMT family transporter [Rhodospirillaceae bacterium]
MSAISSETVDQRATLRGIMAICLTASLFSIGDVMAKYVTQDYPVLLAVWVRYCAQMIVMSMLFMPRRPLDLVKSKRPWLQIARSGTNVVSTCVFIYAIGFLPIAEATAIGFVSPLMVVALSVPLLGEVVGVRRWTAVGVGFAGALVMIRPGFDAFNWATLLIVFTAFVYAMFQISTRILSAYDKPNVTLFYTSAVGVVMMSMVAPFVWVAMPLWAWGLMAAQGVVGGLAHYFLIKAYTLAPVSIVAPFNYTQIVTSAALGFFVFGAFPDTLTWVGAGIVIGSGLYVIYRETHLIRSGVAAERRAAKTG